MDLLVDRELVITPERLERIHQAVLFYADRVSLRATSEVPGGDPAIIARLRELQEIGAIRTWAHEYEVDDGGRVRGADWKSVLAGPADQVLPLAQVRSLVRQVDDELDITHPVEDSTALREGVAEVVQFRRSVIGLRVADVLATDGLLTAEKRAKTLTAGIDPPPEEPNRYGPIVQTIVDLCTFDRLSDLPLEAVIECRRQMPAFRRYLETRVTSSAELDPSRLAREIIEEYQDLLERYAQGHHARDIAVDAGWDVIGALLPPAVVVKYLGKPLHWSKRHRDFQPFLLLSRIRSHQRHR
jgi:hypothetical protein